MPIGTPSIKVNAVKRFGGKFVKVVIYGQDFDEAKKECDRIVEEEGRVYVPPFDDPFVIAGQGTIGLEILKEIAAPDAVFVQIGGGGLASGISEYIKGKVSPPNTKVIGVEAVDQDAMKQSIAKGELVTLDEVGPFADGTAVKTPGVETFRICRKRLDEIVLANNDQICAAIKDIFEGTSTPCDKPMLMDSQTLVLSPSLRVPLPLPGSNDTLKTRGVKIRHSSPSSAVPI